MKVRSQPIGDGKDEDEQDEQDQNYPSKISTFYLFQIT